MKRFLTIGFLLFSVVAFAQPRVLLGQEGKLYRDTLRNLYTQSPLVNVNDSTIGADTTIIATRLRAIKIADSMAVLHAGSTYTNGYGLNLASNTFSVDTTLIQKKLSAGTGIAISGNIIYATGGGGGGSSALSSITAATATNTINSGDYQQEWQWNTLSGTGLKLSSTSTAAASNLQKLLSLSLSGANATASQTAYAAYISNTHTGTLSTNIGVYAEASGGATANYAFYTPGVYMHNNGAQNNAAPTALIFHNAGSGNGTGNTIEFQPYGGKLDWTYGNGLRVYSQGTVLSATIGGGSIVIPSNITLGGTLNYSGSGDNTISSSGSGTSYTTFQAGGGFRWNGYLNPYTRLMQLTHNSGNLIIQRGGTFTDIEKAAIQLGDTSKAFVPNKGTQTQRDYITSGINSGSIAGGSGYTNGTYTGVQLSGGTGVFAIATITVSSGAVNSITLTNRGSGYTVGDVLSASGIGAGSGFTYTVTSLTSSNSTIVVSGMQYYCTNCTATDASTGVMQVWNGTTWKNMW